MHLFCRQTTPQREILSWACSLVSSSRFTNQVGQELGVSLYWRPPCRETWGIGNKCSSSHIPFSSQQYQVVWRKWNIAFKDKRESELRSHQNLREIHGATCSLPLSFSGSSLPDFNMDKLPMRPFNFMAFFHPHCFWFLWFSHWLYELGALIISLLYWCENRLKDVKYLVQSHIVSRWRGARVWT